MFRKNFSNRQNQIIRKLPTMLKIPVTEAWVKTRKGGTSVPQCLNYKSVKHEYGDTQ